MLLNLLINYYVLIELISQDKCKKNQLKLYHKNANSVISANIADFCVITEKLECLFKDIRCFIIHY